MKTRGWMVYLGVLVMGPVGAGSAHGAPPLSKLAVSIVWSEHQAWIPREPGTSVFILPDVRLHGLRDVRPMASMIERFPGLHVAFDLSPILLEQLDAYDHGAVDRALLVINRPADRLTPGEKAQIEATLFSAPEGSFERFAAYRLLRDKPRETYTTQDWRDLQVWHLLAWLGADELSASPFVDLVQQQHGFTESQKLMALYRAHGLLNSTLSLYKRLQATGQIEVVSSPYFHPTLSLFPDRDAAEQITLACNLYRTLFECPEQGMVLAQGAPAQSVTPTLQANGLQWLLSPYPRPGPPSGLESSGPVWLAPLSALRDVPPGADGHAAARAILSRLHELASRHRTHPGWVCLDMDVQDLESRFPGTWEAFVTDLYRGLLNSRWATTVTPSQALDARHLVLAPTSIDVLQRPWSEAALRQQRLLLAARRHLEAYRHDHGETFRFQRAHRLLLTAEASDWFAFAASHDRLSSEFEHLLAEAYQTIGAPVDALLAASRDGAIASPMATSTLMVTLPDATGDCLGPGNLVPPLDTRMNPENYDLRQLEVCEAGDDWVFTIYLGRIDNPWHAPNRLGLPTLDLYLSTRPSSGSQTPLLTARGAYADRPWEAALVLEGYQPALFGPDDQKLSVLKPVVDSWRRRVSVSVPKRLLPGTPSTWRYLLLSLAVDGFSPGRVRPLSVRPDLWHFSGHGAPILDVLDPQGDQAKLLDPRQPRIVLPFVAPRPLIDRF